MPQHDPPLAVLLSEILLEFTQTQDRESAIFTLKNAILIAEKTECPEEPAVFAPLNYCLKILGPVYHKSVRGLFATGQTEVRFVAYFATIEEAQEEATLMATQEGGCGTPNRVVAELCNARDIAQQHLEDLCARVGALVDEAMRSGDLYGDEMHGHPSICAELADEIESVVLPCFEDGSPSEMGWVGSDGQP